MQIDFSWTSIGVTLLRLLLATFLSAAIGYEREKIKRPAGMRTHIVVGVASALIMSLGLSLAEAPWGTAISFDPSRLAAGVISGIGFLGAGTIFRGGDGVRGLTTAATLWATACIGIAAGSGNWPAALIATVIILLVLRLMVGVEERSSFGRRICKYELRINGGLDRLKDLESILNSNDLILNDQSVLGISPDVGSGEQLRLELHLQLRRREPEVKLSRLFSNIYWIKSFSQLD